MKTNTKDPLLPPGETEKFKKQVDLACRLLDAGFLREVLERFGLEDLPDSPEFLENASSQLEGWKSKGKGVQVQEVSEFRSRCIACSFGKTVRAYRLIFSVPFPNGAKITYTDHFAVNLLIENERLMDFGWCNAFLNQEEMREVESGSN